MAKFSIIDQSHETIQARGKAYGEWIEYSALITIKDGGKNPVTIDMTFDSIPPFAIQWPSIHKIRAENLTQAYSKVVKFLGRYGFAFKYGELPSHPFDLKKLLDPSWNFSNLTIAFCPFLPLLLFVKARRPKSV
jgi:hypothetical protein